MRMQKMPVSGKVTDKMKKSAPNYKGTYQGPKTPLTQKAPKRGVQNTPGQMAPRGYKGGAVKSPNSQLNNVLGNLKKYGSAVGQPRNRKRGVTPRPTPVRRGSR